VAFANKLQDIEGIVVVYLGDAVLEEGVLFETLSFASLHSLPILFVVENNRLSVHTHISQRQPLRKLKDIGPAFNLKADEFDSSDVDEVSKICKDYVEYVRENSKPALIFFETFRSLEHVGPNEDFDLGYRDKKEVIHWLARDPVEISYNKLVKDFLQIADVKNLQSKIDGYVNKVWEVALKSDMARP